MTRKKATQPTISLPSDMSAAKALAILDEILDEPAASIQEAGVRRKLTAKEVIFRRLQAKAAGGSTAAFKVISDDYEQSRALEKQLQALTTAQQKSLAPMLRGGVLTPPKEADFETFCAQFRRGFTDEERITYCEMKRQEDEDERRLATIPR